MARAIKCDLCGKFQTLESLKRNNNMIRHYMIQERTESGYEPIDVCSKCYDKFIDSFKVQEPYIEVKPCILGNRR